MEQEKQSLEHLLKAMEDCTKALEAQIQLNKILSEHLSEVTFTVNALTIGEAIVLVWLACWSIF